MNLSYYYNTLKYEQGPLREILEPQKRFLEWFYQGGGPGDQLDDVRTLPVCFWRVLESYLLTSRKHLYFGACLLAKTNCPPVSFAPMRIPSSYF